MKSLVLRGPDRRPQFAAGAPSRLDVGIGVGAGVLFGSLLFLLGALQALLWFGLVVVLFVLVQRPDAFLFITILPYTALQIFLRQIPALTVAGVTINVSQAVMLGVAALLTFRMMSELGTAGWLPRLTGAHCVYAAFVAWSAVLIVPADNGDWPTVIGRLLACLVIHCTGYWLALRRTFWIQATIGAAAFVAAVSAAVDRFLRDTSLDFMAIGAIRSRGSFSTAVATAVIAFSALPVYTNLWLRRRSRAESVVAVAGFAAVAAAIVLTLTRTAVVGVVLFAFFLMIWGRRGRGARRGSMTLRTLVPVVLVLGALYLVPSEQIDRRLQDLTGLSQGEGFGEKTGSGRGGIWAGVLGELRQSTPWELLIGHGLGEVWDATERALNERIDSHNSYLSVLYDLGIVGLLLYAGVFLVHIRLLRPTERDPEDVAVTKGVWRAYCAAYALSAVMFNGYVYVAGPTWFTLLGLGYALSVGHARREGAGGSPSRA